MSRMVYKIGAVFKTDSAGKVVILEEIPNTGKDARFKVQFENTKHITECSMSQLRKGFIKDRTIPAVYGIGYMGEGKYTSKENNKITPAYRAWTSMLSRCYDPKFQERYPTYIGCSVDSDWHNFQTFAEWFYPRYKEKYQVDKDKLVAGNKLYSADTCCLLSPQENTAISCAKPFALMSPTGEVVQGVNLRAFCRENNLHQGNMQGLLTGRVKSCKGWVLK